MPYEWITTDKSKGAKAELHLWPYRSLPRRGFVWLMGLLACGLAVPLFAFIGHVILWLFLPILLGTLGLVWYFIERSYKDGEILEVLTLTANQITLTRDGPRGAHSEWQANPYWVTVECHKTGGPVPDYITLKGDGREVEIGAFLSEDERPVLYRDLLQTLRDSKSHS